MTNLCPTWIPQNCLKISRKSATEKLHNEQGDIDMGIRDEIFDKAAEEPSEAKDTISLFTADLVRTAEVKA